MKSHGSLISIMTLESVGRPRLNSLQGLGISLLTTGFKWLRCASSLLYNCYRRFFSWD